MSTHETLVIGLTGGMGSGKSTVARMLERRGAAIIDADQYAREVVARGAPALEAIRKEFGGAAISSEGDLDREAMARLVFRDPDARARLEAITHPLIAERARAALQELKSKGVPIVIYEAALIVEKRLHESMDGLIVVAAPRETQIRRVMERDGTSREAVLARLAAQLPLDEKIREADWVVDNGGSLEETEEQVEEVWRAARHAGE